MAEAAEERASHLGSNKPINSGTTDSNGVIDPSTGKPLQWGDDDGWREGWKGEAKAAVARAEEEKQNKKVRVRLKSSYRGKPGLQRPRHAPLKIEYNIPLTPPSVKTCKICKTIL